MKLQKVCVLGATGSIGVSTLDVVARHPDRFQVHSLSAYSRIDKLVEQAVASHARVVVVPDDDAARRLRSLWPAGKALPEVRVGASALAETAADSEVNVVMAAIVGTAGLPAALAAAQAGKRVLLANKEALVAAGGLFMQAVRDNGAELLPIDSEHNAIFQCLPEEAGKARAPRQPAKGVRRLLLTASGGPFRTTALDALHNVTPAQACAHPNWSMGRKISVDSATMLNKGLEVIEAHWLFAMGPDQIQVLIHPQSLVHSMVEYEDGSILAQLGQPDMRTPIAYGLGFPERIDSGVGLFELARMQTLDFAPPEPGRFPCLGLAYDALRAGQSSCINLNAANEVAVERFLGGEIRYTEIPQIIGACLERLDAVSATPSTLEDVLEQDRHARAIAAELCMTRA